MQIEPENAIEYQAELWFVLRVERNVLTISKIRDDFDAVQYIPLEDVDAVFEEKEEAVG